MGQENQLKAADLIVNQQKQYLNDNTYAGSYIRTTDNIVVFYTTNVTAVDTILNLPAVIPIKHLLSFNVSAQNHFNLADLKARRNRVYQIAFDNNPVLLTIFVDVELNNIVVSLYHENDNVNRKFIDEVNQIIQNPPIVFESKDLSNNEQINSNASAIMRRVIQIPLLAGDGFCNLDQSLTCSLDYFGMRQAETGGLESVFVTSGRCYQGEIDYYLKPWGPLGIPPPNVYYRIGIMDTSETWYDYGILRIGDEVEPIPSIKNIDSHYYPEIQIWGRNLNQNIHLGIHLCKSGYHTRVTCGYQRSNDALFFTNTDRYKIAYIINIDNNRQDVGGPVFQFLNLSTASLFGILTGGIGNIGLTTNLDDIVRLAEVSPVGIGQ
ncbi:23355_t:CDS:2 [Gigaspora rosea]|nr:23355_t:CDS:2 [Gigaspora rosea]